MVAGITGAIWELRPAEVNSATLHSGAHAVPIVAAATAWGALGAVWAEASTTVARTMAEVGVGMEGLGGVAALAKLTTFLGWAGQQTAMSATMAAKATGNATAYGVAALAMPSPPEIIATNAAVTAAHTPPGIVSGSFALAEAARVAMDARAAAVMEVYEAATTFIATTPGEFLMPPPIVPGAGSAAEGGQAAQGAVMQANPSDPLQATIAAAQAVASNPSVISTATQAAQSAASMAASGVSSAGSAASTAISSAVHGSSGVPSFAGPMMAGVGMAGGGVAAGASTRAVSFSGNSTVGIGNNAGSLKLPEGWGAGAIGATPGTAPTTTVDPVPTASQAGAPAPARTAGTGGNPLLGNQGHADEDEAEHKRNEYLRGDHIGEGGLIAPGVIGGDPSAESAR
ncbi:PPE-repeat protein [Nocardia transvalensis]|uniref:PPE-repeat protein n=1 Tax=Nocardia transvalensis TaxID=37333 RepID=A0A7W9UI19_9NOCA|nr:PPE family protein [Nocardia transvalensis]MBB5913697.1 PPE-repeat protein [Nocardia transvalensis]